MERVANFLSHKSFIPFILPSGSLRRRNGTLLTHAWDGTKDRTDALSRHSFIASGRVVKFYEERETLL